jgi:hypothetical protein
VSGMFGETDDSDTCGVTFDIWAGFCEGDAWDLKLDW